MRRRIKRKIFKRRRSLRGPGQNSLLNIDKIDNFNYTLKLLISNKNTVVKKIKNYIKITKKKLLINNNTRINSCYEKVDNNSFFFKKEFDDIFFKNNPEKKKEPLVKSLNNLITKFTNHINNKICLYFLINFCPMGLSLFFLQRLLKPKTYKESLTNFTPLVFLKKKIQKIIMEKKRKPLIPYHTYLVKFLLTFFEKFFNLKAFFKLNFFKSFDNLLSNKLRISKRFRKYRRFEIRIGKGFFFLNH